MSGLVPTLRARRVWQRNATTYRRVWLSNLLGHLADPLFYLAVLGFGLGALMPPIGDMPYVNFLFAGVVAGAAMSSACFEGSWSAFLRMRNQGTFDAILATPLSVADIAGGEVAWAATKGVISAMATLTIGLVFGIFEPGWGILAVLAAIPLQGFFFGGVALAIAARVATIEGLNHFYALFIMPFLFLSGVFFPLDGMPTALWWVAQANPLTHTVHLVRPLTAGVVPDDWVVEVLLLLPGAILGTAAAVLSLRRRMLV